jgi:hypothetical protein
VTLFEEVDDGPDPEALVAETVKEYALPLLRPVTVSGLAGPEAVRPPGLEVTV